MVLQSIVFMVVIGRTLSTSECDGNIFGSKCFKVFDWATNWNNALSQCQAWGGSLASVHSSAENDFLASYLVAQSSKCCFWFGLNDMNSEGRWQWTDGSDVSYTNMIPTKPNGGSSENCFLIETRSSPWEYVYSGWDDYFCSRSDAILGFVCSKCFLSGFFGSKCTACPPGSYSTAGSSSCMLCSRGQFSSSEGATLCMDCDRGMFSSKAGLSVCSNCLAGTFSSFPGRLSCEVCSEGTFSTEGATNCRPCFPGTYSEATGVSACDPCERGATSQSSCASCSAGTFSGPGARKCSSCSPGTFTESEGSGSCNVCSAGTFSEGGKTTCTQCGSGSTSLAGQDCISLYVFIVPPIAVCVLCCSGTLALYFCRRKAADDSVNDLENPKNNKVNPQDQDKNKQSSSASRVKPCSVETEAHVFFAVIARNYEIANGYFNSAFNRCYCTQCYPTNFPSVIDADGPSCYIVPREWYRFGLAVPPGLIQQERIFKDWSVSFHGTRPHLLRSILANGFAMPGDRLLDGSRLHSDNCAGREDHCIYTSPTIKYAGLGFYTGLVDFTYGGRRMFGQTVLQCRQRPGTFRKQGETMNFRQAWGQTVICDQLPDQSEIEWVTEIRPGVVPIGLLVRVFDEDHVPSNLRSPVDGNRLAALGGLAWPAQVLKCRTANTTDGNQIFSGEGSS